MLGHHSQSRSPSSKQPGRMAPPKVLLGDMVAFCGSFNVNPKPWTKPATTWLLTKSLEPVGDRLIVTKAGPI